MNYFDPRYKQLLVSKLENIIKKKQTVLSVAGEMSVSRQTIHKHLLRYRRFGEDGIAQAQFRKKYRPAHNKTAEALERCVIELAGRCGADGVETLADRLQYEYNTTLHPTTI
ncbi:MAG: leucine zipper domain-containing protein, partial [bacterium]